MRPRFRLSLVILFVAVSLAASSSVLGQRADSRRIEFPDIPGYITLPGDFHQHTVFSDGLVWPTIRVQEAMRDGLGAMAITDHIEHQPHKGDIPHPDRNRGHQIAAEFSAMADVLLVRGAEVTRSMPPGHINAIFLKNINALRREDPVDALREAARQGAFIFWNHPSWLSQTPDGVARLTRMHRQMLRDRLIHGIEVVNEHEYSEESLQIALDHNLTIMANSDIHGLIDWAHNVPGGGHRPVTLVFAKEKTEAALKEALVERRTVAWFVNTLIGRAEWMDPLLAQSLQLTSSRYRSETTVIDLTLTNRCDVDFLLKNASPYKFYEHTDVIEVKAHQKVKIAVKTLKRLPEVVVAFEVMNAITAPGTHPTITFTANVPARSDAEER